MAVDSVASILTRFLSNAQSHLTAEMAQCILGQQISAHDRARMDDLAERNQAGTLTAGEHDEMVAYATAATILSILKSRARRTLGVALSLDPEAGSGE